jgi:hypothetical protein
MLCRQVFPTTPLLRITMGSIPKPQRMDTLRAGLGSYLWGSVNLGSCIDIQRCVIMAHLFDHRETCRMFCALFCLYWPGGDMTMLLVERALLHVRCKKKIF